MQTIKYAIDKISLLIISLAFFISLFVPLDMSKVQLMLVVGLLGFIMNLFVLNGKIELRNDIIDPRILTFTALGVFISLFIQFIVQLPSQFLVSAWEVYAFYGIAAIAEECFFRFFLITLLELALRNLSVILRNAIIILSNGLLFMIVHLMIYQDAQSLLIVLFTGLTYAFLYVYTKSMVPSLISHVIVNIIASSFIVQSLSLVAGVMIA